MVDSDPIQSAEPGAVHRARAERAALDSIAERLAQQFPELSAEQISDAIRGRHAEFDGSAVRDFVPVLVERAVREDITRAPRHRA